MSGQAVAAPRASSMEDGIYVTMRIDKQLFGVPVRYVRDVLRSQKITAIPLAPKEVAGSLNLRGRIVTVFDVRKRLGLSGANDVAGSMFVVVDHKNELYSLMVDSVGEVLTLSPSSIEKTPSNVGGAWKAISSGIHKLDDELLVIIDVQTLLTL